MPILRLAYTTLFLIALLAVFESWSQVGGQSHLDLMPWYLKLVLGGGAAFSIVKAAAAAVSGERAWNRQTLRWAGILLAFLIGCGLASYYAHLYLEEEEQDEQNVSELRMPPPLWDRTTEVHVTPGRKRGQLTVGHTLLRCAPTKKNPARWYHPPGRVVQI
jgi:hypothetical protein